jgi:hypothetical protein
MSFNPKNRATWVMPPSLFFENAMYIDGRAFRILARKPDFQRFAVWRNNETG